MNKNNSLKWKMLESQLLKNIFPNFDKSYDQLSYYSLVEVAINVDESPSIVAESSTEISFYSIYTNKDLTRRASQSTSHSNITDSVFEGHLMPTKTVMLGELLNLTKSSNDPQIIKVNPINFINNNNEVSYLCEEVIYVPLLDPLTEKLMLTDPEEAKALFALRKIDQERFGIDLVFYMITNRGLPFEKEKREQAIQEKIKELAFMAPRVPMKKGSGSFLCVILNLENELEECAFIRNYKLFDYYSNVIFVTSSLEIRTGDLGRIHYDGSKIDTIFMPMIEWQKTQRRKNFKL